MPTANDRREVGELLNVLQQIRNLANSVLKENKQEPILQKKKRTRNSAKKTLVDHLIEIRDAGFFKQAKTVGEVHSKIETIYQCERNRVAVALLRLLKRKELRKASKIVDGEKEIAYVW